MNQKPEFADPCMYRMPDRIDEEEHDALSDEDEFETTLCCGGQPLAMKHTLD